jgi:hypothetical protein
MSTPTTRHQNRDGSANDDGGGALQQNQRDAENARLDAEDKWEQAASRRSPTEREPASPAPAHQAENTRPRDDDDVKQVLRGEIPPGVHEQDLHDPGSRQAGSPPVKNRS